MTAQPIIRALIDISNHKEEVFQNMQEAWELARKKIKVAQNKQKVYYDRQTRIPTFRVEARVFLYTASPKSGPAYKFALPYKGPYQVTPVSDSVACLRLISRPDSDEVRVSISQ